MHWPRITLALSLGFPFGVSLPQLLRSMHTLVKIVPLSPKLSLHALVQLGEITSGIMAFVALLAKEHEALYDWKQNASNHFLDRDPLCIGLHFPCMCLSDRDS